MTSPKSSADPVGAAMLAALNAAYNAAGTVKGKSDFWTVFLSRLSQSGYTIIENSILNGMSEANSDFAEILSTPPVQAITEAMEALEWIIDATNDPDASEESALDQINERAIEALAIVRPAPSDDAQRENGDKPFVLRKRGLFYRHNAEGYTGNFAEAGRFSKEECLSHIKADGVTYCLANFWKAVPSNTCAPSTLAEFREACLAIVKDEQRRWDHEPEDIIRDAACDVCDIIESAIHALPIPESEAVWRPTQATQDVLAERKRQIDGEGWAPEHDDESHTFGVLARAGACYALYAFQGKMPEPPTLWPFEAEWWKQKHPRRDLIRAAALILADIERLDRALDRSAPLPVPPTKEPTK